MLLRIVATGLTLAVVCLAVGCCEKCGYQTPTVARPCPPGCPDPLVPGRSTAPPPGYLPPNPSYYPPAPAYPGAYPASITDARK